MEDEPLHSVTKITILPAAKANYETLMNTGVVKDVGKGVDEIELMFCPLSLLVPRRGICA